jgi:beta-carotene hydroxylase
MVILRCLVIQHIYIVHLYKVARSPVIMRAFIYEMICIMAYIAIVAMAYVVGWGTQVMLLWILPGYLGVVLCPLMLDWPVHHPHDSRERYTNSAILLFPTPVRFFMEIVFLGHTYHLMHHLFPRIPFYHYGKAYHALAPELATVGAKVKDLAV